MSASGCPHDLEVGLCPGDQLLNRVHHQSRLGAGPGTAHTVLGASKQTWPGTRHWALAPGWCSQLEALTTVDHPPLPGSAQRFLGGSWTRSRQELSAVETKLYSDPGARLRDLSGRVSSRGTHSNPLQGTSKTVPYPKLKKALKTENVYTFGAKTHLGKKSD